MTIATQDSRKSNRLAALESVRGFAAIYVVIGHICNVYLHNPTWGLPFRFGAEVVVLFFLLSGMVVRLSTPDNITVRDFFFKRFKRIYPLFALSLLFSYALACAAEGEWVSPRWGDLVGNLFMLQDFAYARPGVWVEQYYNEALWSLAYEWWFYMFFIGLLKWTSEPRVRNACVLIAAAVAMLIHSNWPNQLSYFVVNFVIWWAAAELARHYMQDGHVRLKTILPWCGALLFFAVVWLYYVLNTPAKDRSLGLYPILDMRRFVAGAVFLVMGVAWFQCWSRGGARLFRWTFGVFRYLAPISYGIYIFHFPIIEFFVHTRLSSHLVACLMIMAVCILSMAYVTEIWIQRWVNRWSFPSRGVYIKHSIQL